MFTLLKNFLRQIQIAYWTFSFKQHTKRVGCGLQVQGPCVIYGDGTIEAGDNLVIRSRAHEKVEIFVAPNAQLMIGNNVFINQGVRIVCTTSISLGDECLLGDESLLIDNDYHGVGGNPPRCAPITLGKGVWLGSRVIVLRGVTIGEKSIIGAGAVVAKSIPTHVLAVGVPARVTKSFDLG